MSIDQSENWSPLAEQRARPSTPAQWLALQMLRWQVKKERRTLARLPDKLLADMGITRADALRESRRAWRDVPTQRIQHQLGKYWLIDID